MDVVDNVFGGNVCGVYNGNELGNIFSNGFVGSLVGFCFYWWLCE